MHQVGQAAEGLDQDVDRPHASSRGAASARDAISRVKQAPPGGDEREEPGVGGQEVLRLGAVGHDGEAPAVRVEQDGLHQDRLDTDPLEPRVDHRVEQEHMSTAHVVLHVAGHDAVAEQLEAREQGVVPERLPGEVRRPAAPRGLAFTALELPDEGVVLLPRLECRVIRVKVLEGAVAEEPLTPVS